MELLSFEQMVKMVNPYVLVALGVLAGFLKQSSLSKTLAVGLPLAIGVAFGLVTAMAHQPEGATLWGVGEHVFILVLVYGAMSTIAGRLVAPWLAKLLPKDEAQPPTGGPAGPG